MAVNYAEKYAGVVDERFREAAKSTPFVNANYDFDGAQTIKIYGIATSPMHNYAMSGANRYGTPEELSTKLQTVMLSQDRSFAFTIDKRNNLDTGGVLEAGSALSRQLNEVVIPEVDRYRFAKMILGAGTREATALTKTNAYEAALDAAATLTDRSVPTDGRIFAVSPGYYKKIKQDSAFVKASDAGQSMVVSGALGMIDGMSVVVLPSSYLMGGLEFLIAHPVATCAAQKIAEYKVHEDAPGISGQLVEGRIYHDCFVLNNKKYALYAHHGAIGDITVESAAGTESGKTIITIKGIDSVIAAGGKLVYKSGASQAAATLAADVSGWTEFDVTPVDGGSYVSGETTATTGHKLAVAVALDGKAYMSGVCTVASAA